MKVNQREQQNLLKCDQLFDSSQWSLTCNTIPDAPSWWPIPYSPMTFGGRDRHTVSEQDERELWLALTT